MMGGGLCWIDYDRDGWLDLYVVNTWSNGEWGRWRGEVGELPASRLYPQRRRELRRRHRRGRRAGRDARQRLRRRRPRRRRLDRSVRHDRARERAAVERRRDGFVDDATLDTPSGAAAFGWHAGAAVGDVDGNGWPDLFVAGYADLNRPIVSATKGFPNTFEPEPDLLFLNDGPVEGGRVVFREVAAALGIEPDGADYGLGAVLSDLDLDGDLDLYVAHDTTPNQLYENRSDRGRRLRRARGSTPVSVTTGAGMGVASGDADGDGRRRPRDDEPTRRASRRVRNTGEEPLALRRCARGERVGRVRGRLDGVGDELGRRRPRRRPRSDGRLGSDPDPRLSRPTVSLPCCWRTPPTASSMRRRPSVSTRSGRVSAAASRPPITTTMGTWTSHSPRSAGRSRCSGTPAPGGRGWKSGRRRRRRAWS